MKMYRLFLMTLAFIGLMNWQPLQAQNGDECGLMLTETQIPCNPDGTYTIDFTLVNNTSYTVVASFFSGITPGGSFSPPFMNTSIPPMSASTPFTSNFTPDMPVLTPTTFCFTVSYFNLENEVCCHFEHCITLLPCDPCDEQLLDLSAYETPDTTDGCCYNVDVTNNYFPGYFSKIKTTILTPGVDFANEFAGTGWGVIPVAANELDWMDNAFSGAVPTGSFTQAINFCFSSVQSWNQTPQIVLFEWYTIDPTGQEVVVCEEIMEFNCEPCVQILEESIVCLPDGSYDYTFTIKNNTTNSSSGSQTVDVVAILYQTTGITVTPNPTQ